MTTNNLSNKNILNKEIGHPTVDSASQGYYQECRLLYSSLPSSSECWLFIHRFVASWSQDGDCGSRHHNPMQQHSKQKGGKGAGIYSQLLLSFSLEKNHSRILSTDFPFISLAKTQVTWLTLTTKKTMRVSGFFNL